MNAITQHSRSLRHAGRAKQYTHAITHKYNICFRFQWQLFFVILFFYYFLSLFLWLLGSFIFFHYSLLLFCCIIFIYYFIHNIIPMQKKKEYAMNVPAKKRKLVHSHFLTSLSTSFLTPFFFVKVKEVATKFSMLSLIPPQQILSLSSTCHALLNILAPTISLIIIIIILL